MPSWKGSRSRYSGRSGVQKRVSSTGGWVYQPARSPTRNRSTISRKVLRLVLRFDPTVPKPAERRNSRRRRSPPEHSRPLDPSAHEKPPPPTDGQVHPIRRAGVVAVGGEASAVEPDPPYSSNLTPESTRAKNRTWVVRYEITPCAWTVAALNPELRSVGTDLQHHPPPPSPRLSHPLAIPPGPRHHAAHSPLVVSQVVDQYSSLTPVT